MTELFLLLLLSAALLGSGVFLTLAWLRWLRHQRALRHARQGKQGERMARRYLERNGFTIVNEQKERCLQIRIDGTPAQFSLRPDFVVRKGARRAVVDAKNGPEAANPLHSATRRQMLEYAYYYDVDDVYLYDALQDKLRHLHFGHRPTSGVHWVVVWLLGVGVGVGVMVALGLLGYRG
jgi:hypothetical protein